MSRLGDELRAEMGIKPELDRLLARQALRDSARLALYSGLVLWVYVCMCVGLTPGILPW